MEPFSPLDTLSLEKAPTSDHFDGRRFYNPTLPRGSAPSFSSVFKMLREGRHRWPASVANVATPRIHVPLSVNDVAITFVNHATFLIQFPGINILVDPVWATHAGPLGWLGPARVREPGVIFDDLPRIDLVLISHNHYDHLDAATMKRLSSRFSPKVLVPLGNKRLIRSFGISDVHEMDWWNDIQIIPSLSIILTPAQHFSARTPFDRQKSLWGGFMIRHRNHQIYFEGDSGYSPHFVDIRKRLGSPDISILGIGAYEPQWFMQPMHMNPAEAVQTHIDLASRRSIAMHFGTFQLSAEAIDRPSIDLRDALHNRGIPEADFLVPLEGETRFFAFAG